MQRCWNNLKDMTEKSYRTLVKLQTCSEGQVGVICRCSLDLLIRTCLTAYAFLRSQTKRNKLKWEKQIHKHVGGTKSNYILSQEIVRVLCILFYYVLLYMLFIHFTLNLPYHVILMVKKFEETEDHPTKTALWIKTHITKNSIPIDPACGSAIVCF